MTVKISLFENEKRQTMRSFGVSGAWWAQLAGGWSEKDEASGLEKRERIAQLLFDDEKGIGLSCYRYNLGAGSKNSGAGRYSEESRRAESFDKPDGGYDWQRDENAVWMLKAAVRYGVEEIVFFANSPIERLTKNHKAYLDRPLYTNLAAENYPLFAKYCLDVCEHFINEGVPVTYLSPVNEPVWVWTEKQEGCHYRPWQVKALMRVFAKELESRSALKGKLKLAGAENGDIRWFNKTYTDIMLADELIRRNIDSLDTHSYCLAPVKLPFLNDRLAFLRRYKKRVDRLYPGTQLVTSEWCHMLSRRHYGMDSALAQAKTMFEDISIADVCSWQLWIACSDVDFCDGLIYLFNDERKFRLTKRYYAFGNFSKFIKKGDVRIKAECGDGQLCLLAFSNEKQLKLIIINEGFETKKMSLDINGSAKMYVTDNLCNLEELSVSTAGFTVLPESVNTLIIDKPVKTPPFKA